MLKDIDPGILRLSALTEGVLRTVYPDIDSDLSRDLRDFYGDVVEGNRYFSTRRHHVVLAWGDEPPAKKSRDDFYPQPVFRTERGKKSHLFMIMIGDANTPEPQPEPDTLRPALPSVSASFHDNIQKHLWERDGNESPVTSKTPSIHLVGRNVANPRDDQSRPTHPFIIYEPIGAPTE